MTDAVRRTDQVRLFPDHAKDLVGILFRAGRHAIGATNADAMVDLGMQGWRLGQPLFCRLLKGRQPGPFFMRMALDIPRENRKDG